jgi:hypothetical protein
MKVSVFWIRNRTVFGCWCAIIQCLVNACAIMKTSGYLTRNGTCLVAGCPMIQCLVISCTVTKMCGCRTRNGTVCQVCNNKMSGHRLSRETKPVYYT